MGNAQRIIKVYSPGYLKFSIYFRINHMTNDPLESNFPIDLPRIPDCY